MKKSLLGFPALPKWPGLLVQGETVSKEQAMEILICTNRWASMGNDPDWADAICKAAGVKQDKLGYMETQDCYRFEAEMGVLELEFLHNSQIVSAWVGGAHGWCHWDGKIQANNYNIGSWPSVEGVLSEWRQIAAAFPFLKLTCHLYSKETCEDGGVPLIEYVVRDGGVTVGTPVTAMNLEFDRTESKYSCDNWLERERGCSLQQLTEAIALVRAKMVK